MLNKIKFFKKSCLLALTSFLNFYQSSQYCNPKHFHLFCSNYFRKAFEESICVSWPLAPTSNPGPQFVVWALTSFHCFFFKKGFVCLATSQYVVQFKKSIVTSWSWDNNHLKHFKHKIFNEVFQRFLKSLKTFKYQSIYIIMSIKKIRQKNAGQILI